MTTSTVPRPILVAQPSQRQAEIVSRLHKAQGQLAGITSMYGDGRSCTDILDQLTAARAAVDAVGLILLEDHISACVRDGIGRAHSDDKIAELVTTVRHFVRSR